MTPRSPITPNRLHFLLNYFHPHYIPPVTNFHLAPASAEPNLKVADSIISAGMRERIWLDAGVKPKAVWLSFLLQSCPEFISSCLLSPSQPLAFTESPSPPVWQASLAHSSCQESELKGARGWMTPLQGLWVEPRISLATIGGRNANPQLPSNNDNAIALFCRRILLV